MSNYYGSAPISHGSSQQYTNSGNHAGPSNVYQTQVRGVEGSRQQQYTPSSYGWANQNQNVLSNANQSTYTDDQWQNRSGSYNYSREYYGSSENGNMNVNGQSRDTYNSQNTQGLNNLAYASGLEPAVPTNNGVRSSQPPPAAYQTPTTSSVPQTHATPSAGASSRYNANILQQPPSAPHTGSNNTHYSSANHQNLALDAASALASAAQNYQPRPIQRGNNVGNTRASNSPAMAVAQSVSQSANPRVTPLYDIGPQVIEHHRKLSEQPRPAIPPVSQTARSVTAMTTERDQVTEQRPESVASERRTENLKPPSKETVQQRPVNPSPQSIANLVSSPSISEPQLQGSTGNNDIMPHYVDPTQVFNPFHKEYERKKRDAIEAEARKKVEEQRRVREQQRLAAETSKRVSRTSPANNTAPEVTKQGHTDPNTESRLNEVSISVANSAPAEDDMALEMQKMMAKMKEFKTSNPSLFQKLWNDMRGGGPSAIPINTPVPQSPSPQITQKDLHSAEDRSAKPAKARQRKSDNTRVSAGGNLNGYKVVIEDNPEGLPDLGRFPAERRIRQSYAKQKTDGPAESQRSPEQVSSDGAAPQNTTTTTTVSAGVVDPGVAWPEPRRRAVALAAVQLLKSNPVNESIQITAQEICSLLERNPSYLDLCTVLESRGLCFQRTVFARELLKTVPELQTPVTKASTPARQDITLISTVAHAQLPTSPPAPSQSMIATQHILQAPLSLPESGPGNLDFSQQAQMPAVSNIVKKEDVKPTSKQSGKTSKAQSLRAPEPQLGSKEAAARKRDFSELIDLTELDDNDNYVLPTKEPRLEPEVPALAFKQLDTNMSSGFIQNSTAPLRFNPLTAPPHSNPHISSARSAYVDSIQAKAATFQKGHQRMILAKKVDRSEALQKSYYDPRTVARDVLIASGRHHSERPLNLHLASLVGSFIDIDSDVSTLDWDAIDPGGPPLPRVEYVDVPAAPPKFRLGDRVRKRVKLTEIENTRNPEEGKRDLHPTPRTPANVNGLASTISQSNSTSVPRSDNLTLFSKLAHRLHQKSIEKSATKGADDAATPSTRKISIDIPVASLPSNTSARAESHHSVRNKTNMDANDTPVPRRGRPPGSKNKNRTLAAMTQQAKAIVAERPSEQTPEQALEPIRHNYKCKWVKCHAELHNVDILKRHVRKKHISDESEIEQGQHVCWWKRCRYLEPDGNGNMVPKQTFSSRKDLETHIHEDHIQPIALRYGDGPKTTNTGKQKPTELDFSKFLYKPSVGPFTRTFSHTDPQSVEAARHRFLSDSDGRSTTPLMSSDGNADRPPDSMVLTKAYPNGPKTDKEKADLAAQNAFMKAHGNKHQDGRKAAEEVVRAMEVRKQKTGPGIDRGGCTLINEARRSTFIQAPGVSGIVPLEY